MRSLIRWQPGLLIQPLVGLELAVIEILPNISAKIGPLATGRHTKSLNLAARVNGSTNFLAPSLFILFSDENKTELN